MTALVFCRLGLQARLRSFAALLSWDAAAAVAPSPLTAEGLTVVPGRARVVKMLDVEGAPASPAGMGRSDACRGSLRAGDCHFCSSTWALLVAAPWQSSGRLAR